MPYFLGFDVSKAKLDYSLIDGQGIEQAIGNVPNEEVAIATVLLTVAGNYPGTDITCVVESTACYHYPLVAMAHAVGMPCVVCNPIVTKQQVKATVRGKKTDRSDAFLVARSGWSGSGRLQTPEPYLSAKHHARSCQKLSVLITSFKAHNTHMTGLLGEELSSEARTALSAVQDAMASARQQLGKDMAAAAEGEAFRLLQTIPGIGPYVAASLIGEIQAMDRFQSAKALTAFAGLDPKVRQSGRTLNNTGKLTKRGSSYLRRSVFIAAGSARQCDPQFRALYDKKRAEGKSYTVAICAVARKLLAVVRSVWLSGQDYVAPEGERVDVGI